MTLRLLAKRRQDKSWHRSKTGERLPRVWGIHLALAGRHGKLKVSFLGFVVGGAGGGGGAGKGGKILSAVCSQLFQFQQALPFLNNLDDSQQR